MKNSPWFLVSLTPGRDRGLFACSGESSLPRALAPG